MVKFMKTEDCFRVKELIEENNKVVKIVKCPEKNCCSDDVWKHGFNYSTLGKQQKYKCKKCGHVWSE